MVVWLFSFFERTSLLFCESVGRVFWRKSAKNVILGGWR